MGNAVRRVIRLETDATGVVAKTIFKSERKKKKGTLLIRPAEKVVRRMAKSSHCGLTRYLDRHTKSNKKNKDGWMWDIVPNVGKSNVKAVKALLKI